MNASFQSPSSVGETVPVSRVCSVSFVITRTAGSVFEQNVAISPCLKDARVRQVIVQQDFKSAALAYNDAMNRATEDVIVFCHQDMYFPESWLDDLERSIRLLDQSDPNWAVLGIWGVTEEGQGLGYVHSNGHGNLGQPFDKPVRVNTLDECVLILRKSSRLQFDPDLPDFHFYGTDICLSARKAGMSCYAISAFCVHNTRTLRIVPAEYFDSYFHIKKAWSEFLPIYTPCGKVARFDRDFYQYFAKKLKFALLRRDSSPRPRLNDPREALRTVPADNPERADRPEYKISNESAHK